MALAPAQNAALAGNAYVGSATCGECHKAISDDFSKNPHFKSVASRKEAPERTGCEGCHGPGREHVESGGDKHMILSFSAMNASQKLNACLRCHAEDLSKANIQRSIHTESGVICTSCHSIHSAQTPKFLLARVQRDLCYGCHVDVRAEFAMPFKHRVNEGVIQCTDCHNPHGTFAPSWRMGNRPRLVDQKLGNEEPCLGCHTDKRGPFVFEHAAVRVDGCESCHVPHGSTNAKLLTRPAVFTMCLECHNGAGTFGRENNGVPLQSPTHNMFEPRFQHCTTCHARIHGSNSSPFFLH